MDIGPFPQWGDPEKIVSMDPWGHLTPSIFKDLMDTDNRGFPPLFSGVGGTS